MFIMTKKYFIVKTKQTYDLTYAFSTENGASPYGALAFSVEVEKQINKFNPSELTQEYAGERVESVSNLFSEEEFLAEHDKLFPDMKDADPEDKLWIPNYDKLHLNKEENNDQ